jgi:hypothetical protein
VGALDAEMVEQAEHVAPQPPDVDRALPASERPWPRVS